MIGNGCSYLCKSRYSLSFWYVKFDFLLQWLISTDEMDWLKSVQFGAGPFNLDDDLNGSMMDFTDMLFSGIMSTPQTYPFPNPREIGETSLRGSETYY